ncbi:peroxiredoxin family protein [Dyadobacter fanqingshengii]|uniref:TlpA family protein disulfide reductase n=1 Tax=Dyadobacter fanqingshengii TaxID=2906443 RepID=A0A9X1P9U5_9BACT|nr:TlpA disulfide reductase family protein [Dyadobacter fanqingshengii]MCF0039728.1 TlpA family protein disulfide reductase [Dyadobacter fanqingshengii]USJ38509.1 TlpA family protein disulfide reductase [Dyadobacter fanqingshengii]
MAQVSSGVSESPKQAITYLLPDGKVFPSEKLDSLSKAWGGVSFSHNAEDDAKGIVHLVRITEEMKRQFEEANTRREQAKASMLNKPAPDFKLKDLQGNLWNLQELRSKIVVLNFWFTSCAPCVQEMPELNELVKAYEGKDVVFLALTFNSAGQVRTFQKKRNFNYTLLPNSGEVDKKYQVGSWPTSMVIDQAGDIKMTMNSSPKVREEIASAINSLM